MSIIFGRLTFDFVNFGAAVESLHQGTATQQQVDSAAARFRHTASLDASYLVFIGLAMSTLR